MQTIFKILFLLIVLVTTACTTAPIRPFEHIQTPRQIVDSQAIKIYRQGIAHLVAYVQSRTDLFPTTTPTNRLLTENERNTVRHIWSSLLDYYLLLDSIRRFHLDDYVLPVTTEQMRSFQIAHSAFLAQYRFALAFIERVEHDPKLAILLNDPVPELGISANSYDKFKLRFLNMAIATEFTAYNVIANSLPKFDSTLTKTATEDTAYIWQAGKGTGEILTLINAVTILKNTSMQLVFPIQAGVSEWMGDTKVLRQDKTLISAPQIQTLSKQLEPGDVMLQRREWYVSNVGLPSFWSHSALYIGTPEQRQSYFNDTEVRRWVIAQGVASGDFEALLHKDSANIYANSLKPPEQNHQTRVLEAISEGVSFTSLEHSAAADSLVVLRPRLNRVEKAQALRRAFRYTGRPYDFNFDFQTDSSLVCTELIYKAYEPAPDFQGIRFNLEEVAGRTVIPANSMARQFDHEFGTAAQQFDMIVFLDGQEKQGIAINNTIDNFRRSWQRPKWHILL